MSDEETRGKGAMKFRNRHAEALHKDKSLRLKRVESERKRYERLSTKEWFKKVYEDDDDEV
jgi:hypothetical protein